MPHRVGGGYHGRCRDKLECLSGSKSDSLCAEKLPYLFRGSGSAGVRHVGGPNHPYPQESHRRCTGISRAIIEGKQLRENKAANANKIEKIDAAAAGAEEEVKAEETVEVTAE